MQTIETKYHGATNVKGSRVSASCEAGRVILNWDHGLGIEDNHKAAAEKLIRKLGWHGRYAIGATRQGYVFVDSGAFADVLCVTHTHEWSRATGRNAVERCACGAER